MARQASWLGYGPSCIVKYTCIYSHRYIHRYVIMYRIMLSPSCCLTLGIDLTFNIPLLIPPVAVSFNYTLGNTSNTQQRSTLIVYTIPLHFILHIVPYIFYVYIHSNAHNRILCQILFILYWYYCKKLWQYNEI